MAAATIRSFSARDQLRRRCTDVITSTCVLVIGVVLGLLLALAPMTQLCKAVLTGCLQKRRTSVEELILVDLPKFTRDRAPAPHSARRTRMSSTSHSG